MSVKIKICGLTTEETYCAALEAGADYIGFVFFPPSPRNIAPARAKELAALRPAGHALRHVGLFVDPEDAAIRAALDDCPLDCLQLTHVSADRAATVRETFGMPVWRSLAVETVGDLPGSLGGIDGLLLDAASTMGSPLPGGNGVTFDWQLLQDWSAPGFWMLAGGLTPDNVQDAIRSTGAAGVDVSSGVERSRGVKDITLIQRFIQQARTA